jgi:hypothetical protein
MKQADLEKHIEDLRQGDLVKVDCAACHHVTLLTPEALLKHSGSVLGPKGSSSRSGDRAPEAPSRKLLRSSYQRATENNDVTAPQIVAQIPSDRSTVTIKYAPASSRL